MLDMESDLFGAAHFDPISHCAEKQARRLHSPRCWCCLHPEQCPSGGQLGRNFDTRMLNGPLQNRLKESIRIKEPLASERHYTQLNYM